MAGRGKAESADRRMDHRATESHLKQRIVELESEVTNLKRRLDELRKAKNTTILKREREVLEVGTPFVKRESKNNDDKEVDKKLLEKDRQWQKELDSVRAKLETEVNILKKNASKETECGHLTEIDFLRQRNEELGNENVAMTTQNRELREKVDALLSDLSIKEANWCEREEKLKLELSRTWGQKYKEWMEQTEVKIADLQRTNALLQMYLKNHRPNGLDPTGQDPSFDMP